ncbi:MAG: tetratricopeptide repeat protein, partial [Candidatus Brocadiaceae bacterium]|nr:tetratricopeptide repeat protein [Candidatus Brocadiaceae bacterium]
MVIWNKIFKNKKWMLLLICCFTISCGNKADYHNKEGLYLYNKRKYDEAIVEFKKALELNQKHYDAHFNLGVVYYAKNMPDESIAELIRAIEVNPNEPKAYYNIAFAYVAKEKVEEAISEYKKAIELYAA